jgi:hypothetical protein
MKQTTKKAKSGLNKQQQHTSMTPLGTESCKGNMAATIFHFAFVSGNAAANYLQELEQ